MSDQRPQIPSRVTVEDVLRLKRSERPAPEFWDRFERELRQKQLAALVERKPWWNSFAVIFRRSAVLRLPVGTAAAVAVTYFAAGHYSQAGRSGRQQIEPAPAERIARVETAAVAPADSDPTASGQAASMRRISAEVPVPSADVTGAQTSRESRPEPMKIAQLVRYVAELDTGGPAEREPMAGRLAVQFDASADADSFLKPVSVRAAGFEDRSISMLHTRRDVDALPTAAALAHRRTTRLLAALESAGACASEPSAPERAKRSAVRYLAEDGWDRSMSRLQADGDRLLIRF